MRWFWQKADRETKVPGDQTDFSHLSRFLATHPGVEAFVEPQTRMTATTVLLVAATGQWTRRRVTDMAALDEVCRRGAVPLYDVTRVGYPQRMRDWNSQHRGDTR